MRIGVYSPNWIGDSVIAIPFIQTLRDHNPGAEIIIVCKDWVSGVYENHPAVTEVLPLSRSQLTGIMNVFKTGTDLKKYDFDKFFTLTDSFRSAFVLWSSKAKRRYGYAGQMRSIFLTDSISMPRKIMHRSEKYLGLGGFDLEVLGKPKIHLSNSEIRWASQEMDELGLKRPVALFPFSVGANRTIPNKILKGWIKDSDADHIVFGSTNDMDSAEKLVGLCDEVSIRSVCGNYSLRESIALISTCKFTLATDSGLGHISAALGIPTISFFGVGKDTETGPKGERSTILKYCSPCMGDSCKDQNKKRMCIKEISRSDIEYAVNSITNL